VEVHQLWITVFGSTKEPVTLYQLGLESRL